MKKSKGQLVLEFIYSKCETQIDGNCFRLCRFDTIKFDDYDLFLLADELDFLDDNYPSVEKLKKYISFISKRLKERMKYMPFDIDFPMNDKHKSIICNFIMYLTSPYGKDYFYCKRKLYRQLQMTDYEIDLFVKKQCGNTIYSHTFVNTAFEKLPIPLDSFVYLKYYRDFTSPYRYIEHLKNLK